LGREEDKPLLEFIDQILNEIEEDKVVVIKPLDNNP
jgi:hypothetical protein